MNRPSPQSPTAWSRRSLKLVLEPIFEAGFKPCSYGFRPEPARARRDRRDPPPGIRAHGNYQWVFEADIRACLDASSHCSLCSL